MNQQTWTMSHKEIERLAVLEKVASGRITQAQAATQMGVCERHVRRLLRGYKQRGAQVTVCEHRHGEIVLLYEGCELASKVHRVGQAPAAPVDAKQLSSMVDKAITRGHRGPGAGPSPDHP